MSEEYLDPRSIFCNCCGKALSSEEDWAVTPQGVFCQSCFEKKLEKDFIHD